MSAAVGIQIGASTTPAELGPVTAEAERLGYGEIWLAEDYFELGGVASAVTALAATGAIPVGLGVVAGPVRHPAVTAMELATVGGAYPGRFMAGLGHGVPGWMGQMGLWPRSPLTSLREASGAVRELLDGGEVNATGDYFRFDRVRLAHPPAAPVPLYLGVHGPESLRLSGELADGTLLGWFSSPGYVSWARDRIDEGRVRGSREDPHSLVALCLLSISADDPAAARNELRRWAAPMLSGLSGSPLLTTSPEGSELLAFLDRAEPVPDALLSRFAAAGDAASCRATVAALIAAGADRVVLVPNPAGFRSTLSMVAQMRAAAVLVSGLAAS